MQAATSLDIPVVATEQYPKGLGHTVSEIDTSRAQVFDKTVFSMVTSDVESQVLNEEKNKDRKSVVLFGIEVFSLSLSRSLSLSLPLSFFLSLALSLSFSLSHSL